MDSVFKVLLIVCCLQLCIAAPRKPRLSLAPDFAPNTYLFNDVSAGQYSFGYDVSDPGTGNNQYRHEQRHANGTVTGNYGYIDPAGRPQLFRYIADENGYRVFSDYIRKPPQQPVVHAAETAPEVTWTRPKKPKNNKKVISKNFMNKLYNGLENN